MSAKLIRIEKNPKGLRYLDTYYFECIDCGEEYFRHKNDSRTSPYCGKCQRKYDNEKQKKRMQAKNTRSIVAELELLKKRAEILMWDTKLDKKHCIELISGRIEELKGDSK